MNNSGAWKLAATGDPKSISLEITVPSTGAIILVYPKFVCAVFNDAWNWLTCALAALI